MESFELKTALFCLIIGIGLVLLVLLGTAILLLLRLAARPRWQYQDSLTFTTSDAQNLKMTIRNGPCCGFCAAPLPQTPAREFASESTSLMVFRCAHCGRETYLPRQYLV